MEWVVVVLEAWLLAATVAAATPRQDNEVPPIELLEFVGDWSAEEQKLIDQATAPRKKSAKPRVTKKDDGDEAAEKRNGPPR